MIQEDKIKVSINRVKKEYDLDYFKADRAIITAPFGQKYFNQTIKRLTDSKAVNKLAKKNKILVIIVTSKETKLAEYPRWLKVILIDEIPNWLPGNTYQNRFIKWAIPLLFKNIRSSIWLDSDVIITNRSLKLEKLFSRIEKHKFIITKHSSRQSWLDEYDAIIKLERCLHPEKVEKQKDFFESVSLPFDIPVVQSKVMGRAHNSDFEALYLEVLSQIFRFSERDQLGIIYAMFKTKLRPVILQEGTMLYTYYSKQINMSSVCFVETNSRMGYWYQDYRRFWIRMLF